MGSIRRTLVVCLLVLSVGGCRAAGPTRTAITIQNASRDSVSIALLPDSSEAAVKEIVNACTERSFAFGARKVTIELRTRAETIRHLLSAETGPTSLLVAVPRSGSVRFQDMPASSIAALSCS